MSLFPNHSIKCRRTHPVGLWILCDIVQTNIWSYERWLSVILIRIKGKGRCEKYPWWGSLNLSAERRTPWPPKILKFCMCVFGQFYTILGSVFVKGIFLCTKLPNFTPDQEKILALLASWSFHRKPTANAWIFTLKR